MHNLPCTKFILGVPSIFAHFFLQLFTLIVGHTKFPPDLHLGLNKLNWNRTTVEFMEELKQCIRDSCKVNVPVDFSVLIFYDWKEFLNRVSAKKYNLIAFSCTKV